MSNLGGGIVLDTSDLDRLEKILDQAAKTAPVISERLLDIHGLRLMSEASSNARSFNRASTGELARSVFYERHRGVRRVGAKVRQAFFLEYGSPKTGAPRPWLTAPAEQAANGLLADATRAAGPW